MPSFGTIFSTAQIHLIWAEISSADLTCYVMSKNKKLRVVTNVGNFFQV